MFDERDLFVTGIGTDVGKTVASAILTEYLQADYWKPVQAGHEDGTDSKFIKAHIKNQASQIHPETYVLDMPASPHLAARDEELYIDPEQILKQYQKIKTAGRRLLIEGAGGLLVPLNDDVKIIDLIKELPVQVVLVNRFYLGSINHSLLTAMVCKSERIPVAGWVFNECPDWYREEIVEWSGYPELFTLPELSPLNSDQLCGFASTLPS